MKQEELQQKKEYRQKVAALIEEKERQGGEAFFEDVEEDAPSKSIEPDEVDYLQKKLYLLETALTTRHNILTSLIKLV